MDSPDQNNTQTSELIDMKKRKCDEALVESLKKVKYEDISDNNTKSKTKELYKPPTVEELNELKETENLYNNNLFRLQIEELLKEIQIKNKHKTRFANWYKEFENFINELPEFEPILLSDLTETTKKTKKLNEQQQFVKKLTKNVVELCRCDQNLKLHFIKPEAIEIFGLNKISALPGPVLYANINLKMPKICFQAKDYINNRYLLKRYYYLLYIAECLEQTNICNEISIKFHNDSNLSAILQVIPNNSQKIVINIYVTPAEGQFKPSRFLCDKSNVKDNVFEEFNELFKDNPSPFYNSTLLFDLTLSLNQRFIQTTLADLTNVQEGIKLICVWLKQRELSFIEDFAVYIITYLVMKKKINKHMSSYQVIRNFWSFLNETDLKTNPISLGDVKFNEFEDFKNNFDVILIDRSGCYNIAAFIHFELYKKIKTECQLAFELLDDGGINSFHSLFINKLPFELQYDLVLSSSIIEYKNIKLDEDIKRRFVGHPQVLAVKYLVDVLRKGLNKRALYIVPKFEKNFKWVYGKKIKQQIERIIFGINLDPEHCFNVIEIGPALNDPKEKEFKEFWGRLSTDRRFKDGSVCVAVYFESNTIHDKRQIIKEIIRFLMKDKLQLTFHLYYNNFEKMLINKKIIAPYAVGTNEETSLKVTTISDDLGKKLRALQMPLSITGVQGISDVYSFTDAFPPISAKFDNSINYTTIVGNNIVFNNEEIDVIPRYIQPIDCVLQLEHSSKWPKNLESLQHMKQAFYLEISKLLAKSNKIVSNLKTDFLEVLYKGLVFRYNLCLPREIGLLKKESTISGVTVYKNSIKSNEMEKKLNILPKITGALKGIQSQYPSYGPSTALIKRWLRSQLIDNFHFPDIVINLLNASLFLNKSPFIPPNSPQLAFFRFLKYLAEFQWNMQAVIVNFNDEISREEINEIDSKLLQNRNAYPELFILMPYDNCESLFTKMAPTKEILQRVKLLAIEVLKIFHNFVIENKHLNIKPLFVPNLEGYNVIIHLRASLNPCRHEAFDGESGEKIALEPFNERATDNKIPITNFNPIEMYLKELRRNYGDFALFFHDSYGGHVIGILWKPKALEERDFKVSYINGRKLNKNNKLILNLDGLIEDFSILGEGLIEFIDKK